MSPPERRARDVRGYHDVGDVADTGHAHGNRRRRQPNGNADRQPAGTGTLPAPSLLSPAYDARFNAGQTIVFDWSDVAGAASYTIQIDDQESFSSPTVQQTVSASTYSTSTLPTTRMWWRVRTVNAAGAPGGWSSARRFELR